MAHSLSWSVAPCRVHEKQLGMGRQLEVSLHTDFNLHLPKLPYTPFEEDFPFYSNLPIG